MPEILHVVFIGEGASVMLQAPSDLLSLCRSQEFGGRWVVVHDEEGDAG
jgi:hypothetical protein